MANNINIQKFQERYYSGVGGRNTPFYICNIMTVLARILEENGFILRSGRAIGADTAFENGVSNKSRKSIFLSDAFFFNSNKPQLYNKYQVQDARIFIFNNNVHPVWERLPEHSRKLHTRNVFIVTGLDMKTFSKFTVCWTKDGSEKSSDVSIRTGGTGTAIVISDTFNIPVYNLKNESSLIIILKYIEKKAGKSVVEKLINDLPFDVKIT